MPDGFFTAADGVRLYWRSIGDGPVVVDLAHMVERDPGHAPKLYDGVPVVQR